jgi:hypothetical protein
MMVCRVVLNSRAISAMLTPALSRSMAVARSSALSAGGLPNCFPPPGTLFDRRSVTWMPEFNNTSRRANLHPKINASLRQAKIKSNQYRAQWFPEKNPVELRGIEAIHTRKQSRETARHSLSTGKSLFWNSVIAQSWFVAHDLAAFDTAA